jgi:hypothetical protein
MGKRLLDHLAAVRPTKKLRNGLNTDSTANGSSSTPIPSPPRKSASVSPIKPPKPDPLVVVRAASKAKSRVIRTQTSKIDELQEQVQTAMTLQDAYKTLCIQFEQLKSRHEFATASIGCLQSSNKALERNLAHSCAVIKARDSALEQGKAALQMAEQRCNSIAKSRNRLRKELKKLHARDARAAKRQKQQEGKRPVFHIREHGRVRDNVRDTILDLISMDVPSGKMLRVFATLATLYGIDLAGSFSEATVLRVVDEGGLAALAQLGHAMTEAESEL